MRRILLLFCYTIMCTQLFAQLSRTVNVTAESGLSAQLGTDATIVTDLVVTGTLSLADMTFINDVKTNLPMLSTFDLGRAILPSTTFAGMQPQLDYSKVVATPSVTSIILPNSIEVIGKYAFLKFTNLQSVTFPSNLKTLSDYSFSGCSKLNNIKLPISLQTFGSGVFSDCLALESIVIPSYIKSATYQLFQGCSNLKSVELPDGLTDIVASAFASCKSLNNVVIPNTVKTIGWSAFSSCTTLNNITLPSNDLFTKIERNVFSGCTSLQELIIPSSVQTIGEGTFSNCFSLKKITLPTNPSFTILDANIFNRCTSLQELRIPSSVTNIKLNAFANCTSLVSIICDAEVPPVFTSNNNWGTFNMPACKLTVPPASLSSYKQAPVWNTFGTTIGTGINKTIDSDLSIIQGNNSLYVSSSKQLKSIEVYNLSGVLIGSQMGSNTASFEKLPKGLVIVKVMDLDGRADMFKQIIK